MSIKRKVFTEQGIYKLATILTTKKAIQITIDRLEPISIPLKGRKMIKRNFVSLQNLSFDPLCKMQDPSCRILFQHLKSLYANY